MTVRSRSSLRNHKSVCILCLVHVDAPSSSLFPLSGLPRIAFKLCRHTDVLDNMVVRASNITSSLPNLPKTFCALASYATDLLHFPGSLCLHPPAHYMCADPSPAGDLAPTLVLLASMLWARSPDHRYSYPCTLYSLQPPYRAVFAMSTIYPRSRSRSRSGLCSRTIFVHVLRSTFALASRISMPFFDQARSRTITQCILILSAPYPNFAAPNHIHGCATVGCVSNQARKSMSPTTYTHANTSRFL